MESGNNQYDNSRNDNIYIYTERRTMCDNIHIRYYNHSTNCSDICSNWSAMSKRCCTLASCKFNEWNQRNMESCNNQYDNSRNDNIYIYSERRTMCDNIHIRYYNHSANCSDI